MFSVLRNRNFARIYLAGVASASGFSIGQIALILIVYANKGSSSEASFNVAYVGIAFILAAVVFSLAAGAMVDRYERRRLMVLSDLARAAILVLLVGTLTVVGFSLPAVLVTAFVIGSFTTLFQPAERALTPEIVGKEELVNANALVQASSSIIQFAGNSIGGLLVATVGVVVALSLNSATFVVSALLIVGVVGYTGHIRQGVTGGAKPSALDDIKEGFRYIVKFRVLLYLTLSAGLGNFFLTMAFQFFVFYADKILNGGGGQVGILYGLLVGLFSLGWAPGAFAAARFNTVRFAGKVWILCGVAEGACIGLLVLFPQPLVALPTAFMIGVFLGLTNATWLTIVQLIVPTEMQGRYFGLDQLGSFAVIPVGQVLGAVVVATSGVGFDFMIASLGVMVSAGIFVFTGLRKLKWEKPVAGSSEASPKGM